MWYRTVPALSPRYRVIRFDNRGVGRSDVPPGAYRVSDMAEDAAAVLDAAEVDAAFVVGASLGGAIAQEFALRHPSRVGGLVLVATLCGGPRMVRAEPEVAEVAEVAAKVLARGEMPAEEVIRVWNPYIYDPGTPDIDEDLAIRLRTYPSTQGYLGQLQAMLSWLSYEQLPEITAPTLVIHGESDRLVPPANGRIIAEHIPGARLTLIPRASHILFTDQPEAAHGAMLGFLDELCPSGS